MRGIARLCHVFALESLSQGQWARVLPVATYVAQGGLRARGSANPGQFQIAQEGNYRLLTTEAALGGRITTRGSEPARLHNK